MRTTISYDCGPGSLLIDYAMRYCIPNNQIVDLNGDLAAQGKANQAVVEHFLNAHDYLHHLPPISIATEMFGDHEAQQLIDECLYSGMSETDTIATVTEVTAQNILKQYNRLLQLFFPPGQQVDELFICGSTSHNLRVIDYLESYLPERVVTRSMHDIGIPSDKHQAVCYAYLAFEAVLNQATHPDGALDSTRPNTETVKAKIVPARGWMELVSHMIEFGGGHPLHMATDLSIMNSLEAAVAGMVIL
jgi:1,6-anhydro-N-acetylmuramate kinase